MNGIYHRTGIRLFVPYSEFYFDFGLNDNVYTKVFFWLITNDISMVTEDSAYVMTKHHVILPPPNPSTFIPFNKVDERTALRWIHQHKPDLIELQKKNTELLKLKIAGNPHEDDLSAR